VEVSARGSNKEKREQEKKEGIMRGKDEANIEITLRKYKELQ
jgi:hypothetical protein